MATDVRNLSTDGHHEQLLVMCKERDRTFLETVYAPVLKSMKLHNTFVIDLFFFTVVNLVLI